MTAETISPQGSRARSYLSAFQDAYVRAAEPAEEFHDVPIGPEVLRLRFAGRSLEPLILPAVAHRTQAPGTLDPTLSIDIWDTESTGVIPPRFPWRPTDLGPHGEIDGHNQDGVRTVFHGDLMSQDTDFRALTLFDESARRGSFWVLGPDRLPWWERAAPLRTALHWGLRQPHRLLVHAGAVGLGKGGVLLAGPGGSGKSTSALAAVLAGFDYVGDDYVLLDLNGELPIAHRLYATAKLDPATGSLLPELRDALSDVEGFDGEKAIVSIGTLYPERLRASIPLRAIVLPRIAGGGKGALRAGSPADALRALGPSTIHQAPYDGGSALRPLGELVRRLPIHVLELGDPAAVPPLLADLIDREAGS